MAVRTLFNPVFADESVIAEHSRSLFSPPEDELPTRLVAHLGRDNWREVAAHLPGRNAGQFCDRWQNCLSPGVTNEP
jgi:hypothetical protein